MSRVYVNEAMSLIEEVLQKHLEVFLEARDVLEWVTDASSGLEFPNDAVKAPEKVVKALKRLDVVLTHYRVIEAEFAHELFAVEGDK